MKWITKPMSWAVLDTMHVFHSSRSVPVVASYGSFEKITRSFLYANFEGKEDFTELIRDFVAHPRTGGIWELLIFTLRAWQSVLNLLYNL